MAYDVKNLYTLGNAKVFAQYVVAAMQKTVKSIEVEGNAIKVYKTTDKSDAPISIEIPSASALEAEKTTFVENFVFSAATYPGATNPNLDGKPVLVLASKSGDNATSYNFVNLERLAATTTVDNATEGNLVGLDSDGKLTDSGVAANDVIGAVSGATENNFVLFDANGKIKDANFGVATDAEVREMLDEVGLTATI